MTTHQNLTPNASDEVCQNVFAEHVGSFVSDLKHQGYAHLTLQAKR